MGDSFSVSSFLCPLLLEGGRHHADPLRKSSTQLLLSAFVPFSGLILDAPPSPPYSALEEEDAARGVVSDSSVMLAHQRAIYSNTMFPQNTGTSMLLLMKISATDRLRCGTQDLVLDSVLLIFFSFMGMTRSVYTMTHPSILRSASVLLLRSFIPSQNITPVQYLQYVVRLKNPIVCVSSLALSETESQSKNRGDANL